MDSRITGFVLRQSDYRENDLVLSIAGTSGVVDVLTKGIKKVGAKNKAGCQLFVLSEFLTSQPNQLARAVLTTAEMIEDFRISTDLDAIAVLSVVAEVICRHFRRDDYYQDLYDLLSACKTGSNTWFYFAWLLSSWIRQSGVTPQVDRCHNCGSATVCGVSFSGGFVCQDCLKSFDLRLEKGRLRLFRYLFKAEGKDKQKLASCEYDWRDCELLMQYYLYHQPTDLTSWRFLCQLNGRELK